MPENVTINGQLVLQFTLEEIQTNFWLNDNSKQIFTAHDVKEIIDASWDFQFASTGDFAKQLAGMIATVADENDREKAWFLNEESVGLIKTGLYRLLESSLIFGEPRYKIEQLLKTISSGTEL